jgi:hypothetical protein
MASNLIVGTNSYIAVADALTYFDNRLFADAWTTATPDQQAQSLVMATRAIDRQPLMGRKKSFDTDANDNPLQALEFPRAYSYQIHDIWRGWFKTAIEDEFETLYVEGASMWADVNVPQSVLDATCEEALALLAFGGDARMNLRKAGVTQYRLGRNLQETYDPTIGSGRRLLSIEAREIMTPWLAGAVSII